MTRKATRKTSSSSRRRASNSRQSRRPRTQQAPTPERYSQIQQALIERGYLKGPATGQWGPESVEALKRFQQDHNLEATGKLNALTLIALGLGPSRSALNSPRAAAADGQAALEEKPE
ncbi:MAG: peptidoglycan-binding domain-containing protein [Bryobacteraceae bacterium]